MCSISILWCSYKHGNHLQNKPVSNLSQSRLEQVLNSSANVRKRPKNIVRNEVSTVAERGVTWKEGVPGKKTLGPKRPRSSLRCCKFVFFRKTSDGRNCRSEYSKETLREQKHQTKQQKTDMKTPKNKQKHKTTTKHTNKQHNTNINNKTQNKQHITKTNSK